MSRGVIALLALLLTCGIGGTLAATAAGTWGWIDLPKWSEARTDIQYGIALTAPAMRRQQVMTQDLPYRFANRIDGNLTLPTPKAPQRQPEVIQSPSPKKDRRQIKLAKEIGLNRAPIAKATARLNSDFAPTRVEFSGAGSIDPEGHPLTHTWDFGDGGATARGTVVSHDYKVPGRYLAQLTVADPFGGKSSLVVDIDAKPKPPIAKAIASHRGGTAPLFVTFSARPSKSAHGDALTYQWDLGTDLPILHGMNVGRSYLQPGLYRARLTVTDTRGLQDSTQLFIQLRNQAPTARASVERATLSAPAAQSNDPERQPLTYR